MTRFLEHVAREISNPELVFPTVFDVSQKIRQLSMNPKANLEQILALVSADPMLSARVIHLANAAGMHGTVSHVCCLNAALRRISDPGQLRSAINTLAVEQVVHSKHLAGVRQLSISIGQHSLVVAEIARILAHDTPLDPELAYQMGLEHDIGAFYLLYRCAEERFADDEPGVLIRLVQDWHAQIGHALLSTLGDTPDYVLDAIQAHEEHEPIILADYADLLVVADRLGQRIADWLPAEVRGEPKPLPACISGVQLHTVRMEAVRRLQALTASLC